MSDSQDHPIVVIGDRDLRKRISSLRSRRDRHLTKAARIQREIDLCQRLLESLAEGRSISSGDIFGVQVIVSEDV